jgi:hypothetical protein
MKKGQRMSQGSQRAAEIRKRNSMRRFYEFQKNSLAKNRPKKTSKKKSSNKYSKNDSFTQILKALWKVISKILTKF